MADLTAPEQAAMDAWLRVSADTTGMLYAVRAAIAQMERSEDARLAIAEKALREANELIIGALENGPWVLITDPQLRQLVGEYIADTCHSIAAAASMDEAMQRAHDVMPQRLATALPGRRLTSDARERLARHLYVTSATGDWRDRAAQGWDGGDERINRDRWLSKADELIAIITGKDSR